MNCCLLYCIFSKSKRQPTIGLRGVGLQPIFEITGNGLSAAVSEMECIPTTQDVSQVLIYESVIDALHSKHTLIPMRFGCFLSGPSAVIRMLDERGTAFKATLAEILDCSETGIHILQENSPLSDAHPAAPEERTTRHPGDSSGSGASFLAARRQHYERIDKDGFNHRQLMEQFRSDLAGLFVRSILDDHRHGLPFIPPFVRVVSFRFLVRRLFLQEFCSTTKRVLKKLDQRSFLSAPCPPYSFVAPTS